MMQESPQGDIESRRSSNMLHVNLVQLAARQRLATRSVIAWSIYLTVFVMDYYSYIVLGWMRFSGLIGFGLFCATAWAVVSLTDLMSVYLKDHENWWLGALLPGVQIVVAAVLVRKATGVFRAANIKVTFWGADQEQVRRQVAGSLCRECAYDLTGNVSGVCPECGTRVGECG